MVKALKEALENLVITSIETGNENANYIFENYYISIHEIGPLRRCRICPDQSNGNCPYDNKLDCPIVGKAISKNPFFFQESENNGTDN